MDIKNIEEIKNKNFEYILSNNDNFTMFKKEGISSTSPVFISTLIHGNETCGLNALIKEINEEKEYLNDVYFMIGNIKAAREDKRLLDENFNRIWVEIPKTDNEIIASKVIEFIKRIKPQLILDLHSYEADNVLPHCFTTNTDNKSLEISKKLSEFTFINRGDENLLVDMTKDICPSFIIECGINHSKDADDYAYNSIQKVLNITNTIKTNLELKDISHGIFTNEVNFKFKNNDISFNNDKTASVIIREDIMNFNMKKINEDELFAYSKDLNFLKGHKNDINRYFYIKENKIFFKKNCFLNLFSKNITNMIESGFYLYDEHN